MWEACRLVLLLRSRIVNPANSARLRGGLALQSFVDRKMQTWSTLFQIMLDGMFGVFQFYSFCCQKEYIYFLYSNFL